MIIEFIIGTARYGTVLSYPSPVQRRTERDIHRDTHTHRERERQVGAQEAADFGYV